MERRFGRLPQEIHQRIASISSPRELQRLADRVLVASTLEEMGIE